MIRLKHFAIQFTVLACQIIGLATIETGLVELQIWMIAVNGLATGFCVAWPVYLLNKHRETLKDFVLWDQEFEEVIEIKHW
jgi:hypothetical protein